MEYNIDRINILPFPESKRTSSGKWTQKWSFSLENSFDGNQLDKLSEDLSSTGFSVKLQSTDNKNYKMAIVSIHDTASPEVYSLTCDTFVKIENTMGKLDCIQGRPRHLWFPFRHEAHQWTTHGGSIRDQGDHVNTNRG